MMLRDEIIGIVFILGQRPLNSCQIASCLVSLRVRPMALTISFPAFVWPFAAYRVCSLPLSHLDFTATLCRQGSPSFYRRGNGGWESSWLISSIPVVLRELVPDLRSHDSGDHTSRQYMIDSGDTGWGRIYPRSPPSPVTEVERSIQRSAGDLSLGGTNNTEKLRLISPSWPSSQQTLVTFRMDQT